jgi:hypothetical protein
MGPRLGGVDIWREVDLGEWLSREETTGDQVCEADSGQGDAAVAGGDAEQEVGDHRGDHLETNGIFRAAEKLPQLEMLFDPAEEELDLPADFIKRSRRPGVGDRW